MSRVAHTLACQAFLGTWVLTAAASAQFSTQPSAPALPPAFTAREAAQDGVRFTARHGGLLALCADDSVALVLAGGAPPLVTDAVADTSPTSPTSGTAGTAGTAGVAGVAGVAKAADARLVLGLPGAGPDTRVVAGGPASGRAHYYLGADPEAWATERPLVNALVYRGLSGGVELELHGRHGRLGYDLRVPAGVPLESLVFTLRGAEGLHVDASGRLVAATPAGRLLQDIPAAWTLAADGSRQPVEARFRVLGGDAFGFVAPERELGRALVIDPDLTYASYLGGSSWDRIAAVADAGDGQVLVAGFTSSADFPTTPGAQQPALDGFAAAFVSRIDMGTGTLVWSTFLGGDDPPFLINEQATALALDAAGAVHVGGWTVAADFPTTPGAYARTKAGAIDGFVTKLGSDGLLAWSTYLGGGKDDRVSGLAAGAGGVVVTGYTVSNAGPVFPTTAGAYDTAFSSIFFTPDGFVTKLSADGSALAWSTFLGGVLRDEPAAVHVGAGGLVTVTGLTGSNDFPSTPGAFDETYNGSTANETDAFVTRLAADGSALVWSSFLGGDVPVAARGLSVAADGGVTLAGVVGGGDFPVTPGAVQPAYGGGASDAFLARFAANGSALAWCTFLGGSGDDDAQAVVADAFGLSTLAGSSTSSDLPVTPGAHAVLRAGGADGFIARVSSDGGVLRYGSYLGGSADELLLALALDAHGAAIVAGQTESPDLLRSAGAVDTTYGGGGGDGLLMRLDLPPWADRGLGKPGTGGVTPKLVGAGSLEVGSPGTLTLGGARPNAGAYLFAGFSEGNAPFKGGVLVPFPPAISLVLFTSPSGTLPLGWLVWPAGIPPGFALYVQFWVADPGGFAGSSASNAVRGTQP